MECIGNQISWPSPSSGAPPFVLGGVFHHTAPNRYQRLGKAFLECESQPDICRRAPPGVNKNRNKVTKSFYLCQPPHFHFASSPRLHPNYQQKHFNSDSITPRRFAFINCKPSSALIDRCCFIFDCRKVIKHFSACFFVLSVFSFNDHSNPGLITYQYHRNFSSELKIELD